MNGKTNFNFWSKKKEPICNETSSDFEDDDDFLTDSEFSDVESDEDASGDPDHSQNIYNDVSEVTFDNGNRSEAHADAEVYYENFHSEIAKPKEMQKTLPTLPPRKTDMPKPPARRKKEKKPPLPEKIHLDPEDNQFYEEMNQMTIESSLPTPPAAKYLPRRPPSTRLQQNTTNTFAKVDDQGNKPAPPLALPPRKMPSKPTIALTPQRKDPTLHSSISTRPRIEPPKEKLTENPLNAFRWYHGDSERMVVENKLLQFKRDGMFAVRSSKTKGPSYPYAVTLYQNGKTYNFPIRIRDSDKRFALGTEKKNEPSFDTLDGLIDYFKRNDIKLQNNQSAILNIPLDRSL